MALHDAKKQQRIEALRTSPHLMERAAYYAIAFSWYEAGIFEQAQEDAHKLLALIGQSLDEDNTTS